MAELEVLAMRLEAPVVGLERWSTGSTSLTETLQQHRITCIEVACKVR